MADDVESVDALEAADPAGDDADLGDGGKTNGSGWINPDVDP